MALMLILLTLAVASITHTWFTGSVFAPLHRHIATWEHSRRWWLRIPARGAHCHFCFAHWVAIVLGIGLYVQPDVMPLVMMVAGSILLAQVTLAGFTILVGRQRPPQSRAA